MFKNIRVINVKINEYELNLFASSNIRYVVVNILPWIDFELVAW